MLPSSNPKILDVTIRDGSNLINHQYFPDHIQKIIGGLGQTGLKYAEVGHGLGIGARMMGLPGRVDDEELLEAAKDAAPHLNLSIFIQSSEYSLPLIPGLADFISLGRVAYSPNKKKLTEKIIGKLKKYNKLASCQLVQAHLFTPEEIGKFSKNAEEMGADIVYLVDSFGSFLPDDVSNYLQAILDVSKLPIGFHAHNNLGLALPNTLSAFQNGATWLDASVLGMGRGAGNTILENLVVALEQKGVNSHISLEKICQVAMDHVLPLFGHPPLTRHLDILTAKYKIIFEPPDFLELISASLHIHLDDLFVLLNEKMEKPGTLYKDQLITILKGTGYPIEPLLESLQKQP